MSKPDWDQLSAAYQEGASDVEIARLLGITISRFHEAYEKNDAFAQFVDSGRTLQTAWWYEQGRKNLWNKNFNTALYNFNMKNRFGWADKVEASDTTDREPQNLDQLRAQVGIALKALSKSSPELLSGVNLNIEKPKDTHD